MNNKRPTPAPWHVDYHTTIISQCPIVVSKAGEVCKVEAPVTSSMEEAEANAALIAAAPDLLNSLKALYDSFQHDGNGRTKGNQAKTDIITHNKDVREALNAAGWLIRRIESAVS